MAFNSNPCYAARRDNVVPLEKHSQSPPQPVLHPPAVQCASLKLTLATWPLCWPHSAICQNARRQSLELVTPPLLPSAYHCPPSIRNDRIKGWALVWFQPLSDLAVIIIGRMEEEIERRRTIVREKYARLRADHPALPPSLRNFQVQGACLIQT